MHGASGKHVAWIAAAYVVVGLAGVVVYWQASDAPRRHDRRTSQELHSLDPAVRRAAAWRAAAEKLPVAAGRIAQRLASESDPSVREAYVYALGRLGHPSYFEAVAPVAIHDADPYVRHAGWIAAARMDAGRFRVLAAGAPPSPDPWDRIGRAYGYLEIGDSGGAGDLLELAETGDEGQRRAACTALYRTIAPVLESVGRWPADAAVSDGEAWPPALIAEVRARLARCDVQRIVDDLSRHTKRTGEVRYLAGKLHIARERLAWLLGVSAERAD